MLQYVIHWQRRARHPSRPHPRPVPPRARARMQTPLKRQHHTCNGPLNILNIFNTEIWIRRRVLVGTRPELN